MPSLNCPQPTVLTCSTPTKVPPTQAMQPLSPNKQCFCSIPQGHRDWFGFHKHMALIKELSKHPSSQPAVSWTHVLRRTKEVGSSTAAGCASLPTIHAASQIQTAQSTDSLPEHKHLSQQQPHSCVKMMGPGAPQDVPHWNSPLGISPSEQLRDLELTSP